MFYKTIKKPFSLWQKILIQTTLILCLFSVSHTAQSAETKVLPKDSKIIVIGGALTEIVYALDAQDRIIGRDMTSIYPEAAKALPDIGYMRALSAESILSLAPKGILLVEGSGPKPTIDILEKASVPMVVVPESFSRDGVITKVRSVGKALMLEDKADELITKLNEDFNKTDELTNKVTEKKKILFVLSVQNGRVMAAGSNTAADGIIKLAGAENAITGFDGYKLLNDEALLAAKPDMILSMSPFPGRPVTTQLTDLPAVLATPAAKNNMIKDMDGLYLLGFGPRTAAAARDVAELLYGQNQSK